ncbi:hypothetical protein ABFS83_09G095400 [Erythranthe nasuta]
MHLDKIINPMRLTQLIMVIMLLIAGQEALAVTFKECYSPCFNDCTTNQRKDIPTCGLQCLNECLASSPPGSNKIHYCKLGCAIHECAGFSNDADKMDDCVTKCGSGICKRH